MRMKVTSAIASVVLTLAFILLIPFTWTDIVEFQLWQKTDIIFLEVYPFLTLFKTIHLLIGAICFALGSYHCILVVKINKEAHTVRNNPDFLITDGYYGKVRNPMYTFFLFIFSGLSFALCSSLAIAVAFLVFIVLIILILVEEKYLLKPKFKEKYDVYKKTVPRRLLQNWQILVLCVLLSFNIIGIFF